MTICVDGNAWNNVSFYAWALWWFVTLAEQALETDLSSTILQSVNADVTNIRNRRWWICLFPLSKINATKRKLLLDFCWKKKIRLTAVLATSTLLMRWTYGSNVPLLYSIASNCNFKLKQNKNQVKESEWKSEKVESSRRFNGIQSICLWRNPLWRKKASQYHKVNLRCVYMTYAKRRRWHHSTFTAHTSSFIRPSVIRPGYGKGFKTI